MVSKIDVKYCAKCGTKNDISAKFCFECGNASFYDTIEEYKEVKNNKYCIYCKSKVDTKMKFCPNCGKNEFVNSKDKLDEIELSNIKDNWEEKIKLADKKLDGLLEMISKLKKEKASLDKEYQKIDKEYKEKYEKISNELLELNNKISDNENSYLTELQELKEKKNSLTIAINEMRIKLRSNS